mmetsp:Transcript_10512/g.20410  ORF Transcript_10512/g.20410 Transcript_10512/m.20410 type:complete len:285 (+) Transcript_10512:1-855(+)
MERREEGGIEMKAQEEENFRVDVVPPPASDGDFVSIPESPVSYSEQGMELMAQEPSGENADAQGSNTELLSPAMSGNAMAEAAVVFSSLPPSARNYEILESGLIRTDWWADVGPMIDRHVQGRGANGEICCDGQSCENCESQQCATCGNECTVCVDEMLHGQEVTTLPCGHTFHHSCVTEWLNTNLRNGHPGKCPNCNREIVAPIAPKPQIPASPQNGSSAPVPRGNRGDAVFSCCGRRFVLTYRQRRFVSMSFFLVLLLGWWSMRRLAGDSNQTETTEDQPSP